MENVKASTNAEQQHESKVDEAENLDIFMKAMVQIVEKYGRFVLQSVNVMPTKTVNQQSIFFFYLQKFNPSFFLILRNFELHFFCSIHFVVFNKALYLCD